MQATQQCLKGKFMNRQDKIKLFQAHLLPIYNYMEIGVWKGELIEALFNASSNRNKCSYVLIDPWKVSDTHINAWYSSSVVTQKELDEIYQDVCDKFKSYKNIQIFRNRATDKTFTWHYDIYSISFDLIYIDGEHTYSAVSSDLLFAIDWISTDGCIICDDYRTDKWWNEEVINAVKDFVHDNKNDVQLKVFNDQAIISLL